MHALVSDQFAGVERYVHTLAEAQALAGHTVVVAGGPQDVRAPQGVTRVTAAGTRELSAVVRARAAGADVLHVHMTAGEIAATLGLAAVPRHRRPAVVSTRHFARRRGHGPTGPLVAAVARHTLDAQIAISDYVATAVDGPSIVVHTGIAARPDAPQAAGRERTVLLAQRLQPEKRSDVAVRAFTESGLSHAGWRLVVAGDGAERRDLEDLATTLGAGDAVQFLGARDDVPELMRSAGMLVAPCPVEGLGLSVLEAMASGLPVVAAAAGGHQELLDGVDPVCLAPPGDVAGTAQALAVLGVDDDRRDQVAHRARARQRTDFSIAAQLAGTHDVYESVLRAQQGVRA